MSIHSRPRTLAEMAGINIEKTIIPTPIAVTDSDPQQPRRERTTQDPMESAFQAIYEKLPHSEEVRSAFEEFKVAAYNAGAAGLNSLSEGIRLYAQKTANKDEYEREVELSELCGGGNKPYRAPKDIVNPLIKKTLENDGAYSDIVEEEGFFNKRLEGVRRVAETIAMTATVGERTKMRTEYNNEKNDFIADEVEAFSDESLEKFVSPIVERIIVENLEELVESVVLARARSVGGAIFKRKSDSTFEDLFKAAEVRIKSAIAVMKNGVEVELIAGQVLEGTDYKDLNQANALLLARKRREFVDAVTAESKLVDMAKGLAHTKEYKEFLSLGVRTEATGDILVELKSDVNIDMSPEELRLILASMINNGEDRSAILKRYAKKLHPENPRYAEKSDAEKEKIRELYEVLSGMTMRTQEYKK